MSGQDGDDNDGGRLYRFPRLGFALTPTTAANPGGNPSGSGTLPDWDAVTVPSTGRRSPLDIINALPDPGPTQPLLPAVSPQSGLSGTFRGQRRDGDMVGPRLGALSLAAILAVAVAALRGGATWLEDRRQRRMAQEAEAAPLREARLKAQVARQEAAAKHHLAMQGIGDKAAQQRAKNNKVPSGQEFGRKVLGGGGRSGGSGASGGGSGRSGSGGGRGKTGSGLGSGKGAGGKDAVRNKPGDKKGLTGKPTPRTGPGGGKASGGKGADAKGTGTKLDKKSPSGGKGPRTGASSPAMERTRARQQRAAARQDGRLKRRADRQAARLDGRTKDQDAARTRKNAVKEARQAAKDKARQARADQKEAAKQQTAAADAGRTKLADAIRKTARRRLKKRRKNLAPPILSKTNTAKGGGKKTAKGAGSKGNAGAAAGTAPTAGPGASKTSPRAGAQNTSKPRKQKGTKSPKAPKGAGRWAKARAYARKKAARGSCFGGTGQGSNPQGNPPPGWDSWDLYNEWLRASHAYRTGPRRSPFANAAQAGPTTWSADSPHVPGSRARRWEPAGITPGQPSLPSTGPAALDAAPVPHSARPGTTRPKEARPMPPAHRPDPRITKAKNQAARTGRQVVAQARHMDPQHATEITLDDALDEYGDFKDDGFKTHDQCAKLAGRAIKLRDTLAVFAENLATEHNLIGALFTGAMARMSESMDLVARMAEEMQVSSIEAAEMAEAADNDLNDAYRPYVTATADAGLSTPSAPAHNET